jgi:hypothetical protein
VGAIGPTAGGVRLTLHVQPRASRDEVRGEHGGAIRVRLRAPPVDGAANEALVRFLAQRLGLPRGRIKLVAGASARRKVLEIEGVDATVAAAALGLGAEGGVKTPTG